jgi:hypothetical protein
MVGLLRFILVFGVIYFGVRFLLRLLMPWIIVRMSQSMAKRYGFDTKGFNKKEEVTKKSKPKTPKVGEYIDYQEIDE